MSFSESQNIKNNEELALIRQAILDETQVVTTRQALLMLDDLIGMTLRMFAHKKLLLSDVGKQSLAFLLHDAMVDYRNSEPRVRRNFKAQLEQWVSVTYPSLLNQADKDLQNIMAMQPLNLRRTLIDRNEMPAEVWGDDHDIRVVLHEEIVTPESIHASGKYILPPVSIVAGRGASEQERANPHTFLQNHLQTICKNNPHATITALVPVNVGQLHWMLFKAAIAQGKVENAEMIDSMTGVSPMAQRVAAKATSALGCAKVKSVARKVQKNGYSCMDYTIQKALQEKYESIDEIRDAGLKKVFAAEQAGKLRGAVIDTIIQHDETLAVNEKLVTGDLKQALTDDVAPGQLEKVLHAALTCPASKVMSNIIADNTQKWQIRFDEALAKSLHGLYNDVAKARVSDKELFDEARVIAYRETKEHFRLFGKARKSLALDLSSSQKSEPRP